MIDKRSGLTSASAGDKALDDDFRLFLQYFPEVSLPVNLTFDSHRAFGRDDKPLPELLGARFFTRWEEEVPDDYTEFLPGFQFRSGPHKALVYWKAALLYYAYVLVLLDPKGALLDRLELAVTSAGEEGIRQGAALIQSDGTIHTVESARAEDNPMGDPQHTITERWTINKEGRIVETGETQSKQDD
jgi:hypothetical protein